MGETVGDLEEDRIAIRSNFCSITYQKNTVMIMPKILIVATGIGAYANAILPTGLWLSELTHIYHRAKGLGCKITIASPKGGEIPVDPESLKPFTLDKMSKAYWNDPEFRELLHHAQSLDEVAGRRFDCVYLAGGHGSMYDFPDNAVLPAILKTHFESGKIVSAICHGVCGLLNVGLSDGQLLVAGKKITGFSWFEETLARRKKVVPFDLEAVLKERGADYRKAWIPMTSKVVVDGTLITGQNPLSSKEMAKVVLNHLTKREIR